jgi:hypothetical protein
MSSSSLLRKLHIAYHPPTSVWNLGYLVFAAFLSAAAKANAHWYSVKSLSEGVLSLTELLRMSD